MRYQYRYIAGRRFIYLEDYRLPSTCQSDFSHSTFSLLVDVDGDKPLLYVPTILQCYRGSSYHLNQPAPTYLGHGWKWACWEIEDWSYSKYGGEALINLIDNYFTNYRRT